MEVYVHTKLYCCKFKITFLSYLRFEPALITLIPNFLCKQIGLMRSGKFLAEESPEDLLSKYQCDSLEDVFLKLAVLQNMGKRRRSSIAQEITEQVAVPAATVCTI